MSCLKRLYLTQCIIQIFIPQLWFLTSRRFLTPIELCIYDFHPTVTTRNDESTHDVFSEKLVLVCTGRNWVHTRGGSGMEISCLFFKYIVQVVIHQRQQQWSGTELPTPVASPIPKGGTRVPGSTGRETNNKIWRNISKESLVWYLISIVPYTINQLLPGTITSSSSSSSSENRTMIGLVAGPWLILLNETFESNNPFFQCVSYGREDGVFLLLYQAVCIRNEQD